VLDGTLRFTWSRPEGRGVIGVEPDWEELLTGGEDV
jgi:hypothetical protein